MGSTARFLCATAFQCSFSRSFFCLVLRVRRELGAEAIGTKRWKVASSGWGWDSCCTLFFRGDGVCVFFYGHFRRLYEEILEFCTSEGKRKEMKKFKRRLCQRRTRNATRRLPGIGCNRYQVWFCFVCGINYTIQEAAGNKRDMILQKYPRWLLHAHLTQSVDKW